MSTPAPRPRQHPRERFADTEKVYLLDDEFAAMAEESTVHQGHMQKALYRHGGVTTAIFQFESEGLIREHSVSGESIVHVLTGELAVTTETTTHTLPAGSLLLLKPDVKHDLRATKPTRMLMTVALDHAG